MLRRPAVGRHTKMLTQGAPPLGPFLERCLTLAALAATVAALLLVGQNALAPTQQPWTFGLVFWAWFLALYLTLALPLALGVSWTARRLGLGWLPGAAMLLGPLLVLVIAGLENRRALAGLLAFQGPDRHRWLVPTAAGPAALGLLAAGLPASESTERTAASWSRCWREEICRSSRSCGSAAPGVRCGPSDPRCLPRSGPPSLRAARPRTTASRASRGRDSQEWTTRCPV